MSYSNLINGLTKAGVEVNRKMLAEMAVSDIDSFKKLVDIAKDGLAGKVKKTETKAEVKKEEKVSVKEETPKKTTTTKTTTAKKTTSTKTNASKTTTAKKSSTTTKKATAKKETK